MRARRSTRENVDLSPLDFPRLIKFVKQNAIDLTVVGPETPLGRRNRRCFRGREAAHLRPEPVGGRTRREQGLLQESAAAGQRARRPNIKSFAIRPAAITYLRDREDVPVVVKADGLAAGKGVFVCKNRNEAIDAVQRIGRDRQFGDAGNQLVIEERLDGQEVSVLAMTDGRTIVTLPPAQDHKAAFDGDTGPNTGGMGAYCPTPLVSEADLRKIEEQVLVPTVHAMKRARRPFRGVLYAGLMMTNQGPKVLEFNVRFGDPECEPLLMRLDERSRRVDRRRSSMGGWIRSPRRFGIRGRRFAS